MCVGGWLAGRWGEELDKFKAAVSPPWSNNGDDGVFVCCGAGVYGEERLGEGKRMRKWVVTGSVSF